MKKWVRVLAIVLFMALVLSVTVCAKHFYSTFDTIELTDDEKQYIWRNSKIRKLGTRFGMEHPSPIINFDVSKSGLIVLALAGDKVLVLDSNGTPIQSFTFDREGSYCVGWNQDNILLYKEMSEMGSSKISI